MEVAKSERRRLPLIMLVRQGEQAVSWS